ncbi:flagellar basal body-associated FliL family protein [Pantoea coffeiphila]|nr:flagellar basal body-associated FliL family protein [Pantoea coffeiphila]
MNIKTLILNFILMLVAAIITALLVLAGSRYLDNKSDNSENSSFFSSQPADDKKNLQFVEIKNLVITLKSNSVKERYLLLDLALTTHDEAQSQRAENLLPKIKGIAVDVLTSMDYSEVRSMTVMELRSLMMERYQSAFHNINVTIPFDDVTISKMVFQ